MSKQHKMTTDALKNKIKHSNLQLMRLNPRKNNRMWYIQKRNIKCINAKWTERMLYCRKHLQHHRLNLRQKCAVVSKRENLNSRWGKRIVGWEIWEVIILVYLLLVEYFIQSWAPCFKKNWVWRESRRQWQEWSEV